MKKTLPRSAFVTNLKNIMRMRGIEQIDIVENTDFTRSAVSDWCLGKRYPRVDAMQKLADFLGVSMSDLTQENHGAVTNAAIRIPVLGSIPAGVPIEAIEDIIDWEELPLSWGRGGKEYFGLVVRGNSMYPRYEDGDVIIVRRQDDCESGQDAVIMINGNDATFKRVRKDAHGIALQPINPDYEILSYTNADITELPVRILGVVVELRRKMV